MPIIIFFTMPVRVRWQGGTEPKHPSFNGLAPTLMPMLVFLLAATTPLRAEAADCASIKFCDRCTEVSTSLEQHLLRVRSSRAMAAACVCVCVHVHVRVRVRGGGGVGG